MSHFFLFFSEKEDAVDFTTIPGRATKLSLQAAHDKRNAARNIKRRRATTKRSLFLHQNEQAKYGTDLVDPSKIGVSIIIMVVKYLNPSNIVIGFT